MGFGIKIPKNALKRAKKSMEDEGESIELDPGTYVGHLCKLRGVDTDRGPQVVADIAVGGEEVDEKQLGSTISLWFSFEEDRTKWLVRFLRKVGFDVTIDDIDDDTLEEIAGDIEKDEIVVRFKATENKDGYINYKVSKVLEDMSCSDIGLDGKAEEDEEEEDDDEEEELDGDEFDEMDRTELKSYIKKNKLAVKVLKKHTDDDVRNLIREEAEEEED